MTKNRKASKVILTPGLQLALSIGLFVIATLMVQGKTLPIWEAWLFNFVYGWPDALKPVFLVITQLGNVYVFFALALLLLIKKYYRIVIKLLMSGLLAYLLAGVGKDLIGRGRPIEFFLDLVYRDYMVRGAGFPSGHTALATAVALAIGSYLPKKFKWVVPVVIIGVGLSRIYLGVHLPADIIGGIAIGWFSYALFQNVELKDVKKRKR